MILVEVSLQNVNTGKTIKLGEMYIANEGHASRLADKLVDGHNNYSVQVAQKGWWQKLFARPSDNILRTGRVMDYPSDKYTIWRLVFLALKSTFPWK